MTGARGRVLELVGAARRLADPTDRWGVEARRTLPSRTGLSPEGVSVALETSLECAPTDTDLESLLASVTPARRAWVLLSANVFTAAHRAIALGLATADAVRVRPSRREPEFSRLLRAAGGPFTIVERLAPEPGDVVFAYGRGETLVEVAEALPDGVRLVGHGPGIGVAIVAVDDTERSLDEVADRLSLDVALFDQRGCLSPRAVVCVGDPARTRHFAQLLSEALERRAQRMPIGAIAPEEAAAATRYRETLRFAGTVFESGGGSVGCITDEGARLVVPPSGRNVHVGRASSPATLLAPVADLITAIGVDQPRLGEELRTAFPAARISAIGSMQRPPLDGPADRRARIEA